MIGTLAETLHAKGDAVRNGFKVFDADAHVIYPRELWPKYLDEKYRHRIDWKQPVPGFETYNPVTVDGRWTQHPTVLYGRRSGDRAISREDLERPTPHNTYVIAGLPPTPIANPGRGALEAAVDPAGGDALYFVARGDGSHEFTASLAEHNAAVARYQR